MSGDEVVVLLVSGFVSAFAWINWYAHPIAIRRMGSPTPARPLLFGAPIVAGLILLVVLCTLASFDVRGAPRYILMYLLLGAAWVGITLRFFPYLGISARDDAVERGNRAAGYAIAGAVVGIMLCFAGGNVGDGPGWWVVLFSAGLATASLLAGTFLLDALANVSEHITIERDPAAGLRLGGFLIGAGLILGRGAAGDWVSVSATARDFVMTSWPVLLLLVAATLIERTSRPTPARPHPPVVLLGLVPALVYVAAGVIHVLRLGIPE